MVRYLLSLVSRIINEFHYRDLTLGVRDNDPSNQKLVLYEVEREISRAGVATDTHTWYAERTCQVVRVISIFHFLRYTPR